MFSIGFSQVDITPAPGLRTAGMPNPPETEGVLYPLFARIMVFEGSAHRTANDESQAAGSAAIVSLDSLGLDPVLVSQLRHAMAQAGGIPAKNILIACTHTHSAPFAAAVMAGEIEYDYISFLKERLVEAVQTAWAARQPARLRTGQIEAPGWTFNRRQVYHSALYGEQVGTQGPQTVPEFLRNEGPEDHQLQVLLAMTPEGKSIGGLINYACHPTLSYGDGKHYSADYPGPLTQRLAEHYGAPFAFLQGASGNLWGINTALSASPYESAAAHVDCMVKDLAEKAIQALESGTDLGEGQVRVWKKILQIPQRRPTHEQLELARWYLEKAPKVIDQQAFTRQIYQHDYTFFGNDAFIQEWFAREIIGLWEWQRKAGTREIFETVEVQAVQIGDLVLVGFPVEYFTEFGITIKAGSPFPATFVVELANGWQGYVPTLEAFAHGGYEPRLAYTSRLAPEAGDQMCEAALDLLNQLRSSPSP